MGIRSRIAATARGLAGVVRPRGSGLRADSAPPVVPSPERYDSSLYNSLTGLGGGYDKGASARPNTDREWLDSTELTALWQGNGLARRLVELPARELTRKGWELDDGSPDTDILADVPVAQQLPECVRWGTTWARLYGSSVALLVTDDDIPPGYRDRPWEWLAQPLDLRRVIRLASVPVFDALEASPVDWEANPHAEGFRLPSMWSITPRVPGRGLGAYAQGGRGLGWSRVHASRALLFRGNRRPPSLQSGGRAVDDSVLQAIWDEIRNLTSVMQGGATLAQELRNAVIKVKGLRGIKASDQLSYLLDQIRSFKLAQSILGVTLLGEDDAYESQSNPPTGFSELSTEARTMLSGVSGIPQTILFGEAPAGLNTDGAAGQQTFDRLIAGLEGDVQPLIERAYEVVFASQEGPAEPEAWSVRWLPRDEPTEAEEAGTRKTRAETDAIYVQAGVLDPEEIRASRFGEDGYRSEILPVDGEAESAEVADPAAELTLLRGGAADAAETACLLAFLSPDAAARVDALRAAAEAIVGPLTDPGAPHVTLLFLGAADPAALPEIAAIAATTAGQAGAVRTKPRSVATFPAGADGTPIVLALDWAWGLEALHARLLRRLAHHVAAPQHDEYRPHVTLGYVPAGRTLTGPEVAALLEIRTDPEAPPIAVAEIALTYGGGDHVVARALLAGQADAEALAAK